MPLFERRCEIAVPRGELYAWHARPGAFERLMPPWERMRVISRTGEGIEDGATLVIGVRKGPFELRWVAEHSGHVPGQQFVDTMTRGPFRRWVHTHRFEPAGEGRSALVDHVDYALPFWPVGPLLGGWGVRRMLDHLFTFRHARTTEDLELHARYLDRPRLDVCVEGQGEHADALRAFLTTGGHTLDRDGIRVAGDLDLGRALDALYR